MRRTTVVLALCLVVLVGAGCNLRVTQGNGPSLASDLSADGRTVVYYSSASDIVAGDTNGVQDIFVQDLDTYATVRIGGNGSSYSPAADSDASHVAFISGASNLTADPDPLEGSPDVYVWEAAGGTVTRITDGTTYTGYPDISGAGDRVVFESSGPLLPTDTNGTSDVYLWDAGTGSLTQVTPVGGGSPKISADGAFVTYLSGATSPGPDNNGSGWDIFVWEVATGTTTRATSGNDSSRFPTISGDGSTVAFTSLATDLVAGDTNGVADVFSWDRGTTTTTRLAAGNAGSDYAVISDDGAHIAFQSSATNLTPLGASGQQNIFSVETSTGVITRVTNGNKISADATISADGRYIGFESFANDIGGVPDPNATYDIFIWDREHYED